MSQKGGAIRSSEETSVMGVERRGGVRIQTEVLQPKGMTQMEVKTKREKIPLESVRALVSCSDGSRMS